MKKHTLLTGAMLLALLFAGTARAQLSTNPDKFLGNITTRGQVNGGGIEFNTLWNQLTPENETKWSSVQGGGPNSWNWGGAQNAYNYCKQNGLLFKFHCLAWGSQYPSWIENLTPEERYKAIVKWMDECKKKFPDLKVIDVVNEAVEGHQDGTHFFEEALGGKGITGWDWIINAFNLAHERWPDAILIYNDFNTFQWQRPQFIQLVKTLRDNGAPIDAYGCQSHDLTGYGLSSFRQAVDEIQNNLKMPMYSTEYDIGTNDDNLQLTNYKEQIPYMWEKDYFAGLTLWGYIYGATWTPDGNSGIIKNGQDRPAMKWLREYMKTDAAKNAKSPFPGMVKEADLYIAPPVMGIPMGEVTEIPLNAKLRTKEIERIDFYAGGQLVESIIEAPWVAHYSPGKLGNIELKAVMVATDGTQYVRYGGVKVMEGRSPYRSNPVPGIVEAENFDKGVEGQSFHDSDYTNTGGYNYRTNGGGVDFSSISNATVVSKTEDGEWLEYTVNVKNDGYYSVDATASSGVEGSTFTISVKEGDEYVPLFDSFVVPCLKANSWTTLKALHKRSLVPLTAGQHIIRVTFDKGGCYLDKMQFRLLDIAEDIQVDLSVTPAAVEEADTVKINIDAVAPGRELKYVYLYINDIQQKRFTSVPAEMTYIPTTSGIHRIAAYAVAADEADRQSPMAVFELPVDKKRIPYQGVIAVPGTIEMENFDKMGEGYSFHDSDDVDQGATGYRKDNEGVDILKTNDGYAIGYTLPGEWWEYSIDVQESGIYSYEVQVANGSGTSAAITMDLVQEDGSLLSVINRGARSVSYKTNWNYFTLTGDFVEPLPVGRQLLRVGVKSGSSKAQGAINIDKIILTFKEPGPDGIGQVIEQAGPTTFEVYSTTGILLGKVRATAGSDLSSQIKNLTRQAGIFVVKDAAAGKASTITVN